MKRQIKYLGLDKESIEEKQREKLTLGDHCRLFYKEKFNINIPLFGTKSGDILYRLFIYWSFSCISGKTKKNLKKQNRYLNSINIFLNKKGLI
jgi:hypothetical protein